MNREGSFKLYNLHQSIIHICVGIIMSTLYEQTARLILNRNSKFDTSCENKSGKTME